MAIKKISLLLICVLMISCGSAGAAEISVQEKQADTGSGIFNISADLEEAQGVGFRLSYDPEYLNITNVSGSESSYLRYLLKDGIIRAAVIFPESVTTDGSKSLVQVAYTTLSSEPGCVHMDLHDSEYSHDYQNQAFDNETDGLLSFRSMITDTFRDGNWSAETPLIIRYELLPGVAVQAPSLCNGGSRVILKDLRVSKYTGSLWSPLADSDISLAGNGSVSISGDLGDASKLDLNFTGQLLGDINANGITNSADARDIARQAAHLSSDKNVAFYGDVNTDGTLDTRDAKDVREYAVGILNEHFRNESQ